MTLILIRDGDCFRAESGKLPEGIPDRIALKVDETGISAHAVSQPRVRQTKDGRPIPKADDLRNVDCPYPYEPDL